MKRLVKGYWQQGRAYTFPKTLFVGFYPSNIGKDNIRFFMNTWEWHEYFGFRTRGDLGGVPNAGGYDQRRINSIDVMSDNSIYAFVGYYDYDDTIEVRNVSDNSYVSLGISYDQPSDMYTCKFSYDDAYLYWRTQTRFCVIDTTNWEGLTTPTDPEADGTTITGSTNRYTQISDNETYDLISPGASGIISLGGGLYDIYLRLYDRTTFTQVASGSCPVIRASSSTSNVKPTDACFSHDDELLATSAGVADDLKVFNVSDMSSVTLSLTASTIGYIRQIFWSADDSELYILHTSPGFYDDYYIAVVETTTWTITSNTKFTEDSVPFDVKFIQFNPDTTRMLVCTEETADTMFLYDTSDMSYIREIYYVRYNSFGPQCAVWNEETVTVTYP